MSDILMRSKDGSVDDPDYSVDDDTAGSESDANDAPENPIKKTNVRRKASQYYIGAGVAADCLALITTCSMIEDLNYQKFLKEYVAMGFQYIFCGRKSKAVTLELSEEIISIATSIFLKPNYNSYDDRRPAMYLLYSLAVSQPVESFAFIWVDPNAALVLGQFEIDARKRNDREMLYCMGTLYARGLARFTAADAEYGLSKPILHSRSEFLVKRKKAAIHSNNDFSRHDIEALKTISARMEAYDKCKKEAIDWSDPSDARSLNFTSAGDLDGLMSIMKKLHMGVYDLNPQPSLQNNTVNHGETIHQKKMSAMAAPVKQAKHRVTKSEKCGGFTKKHSPVKKPNKKPNKRGKSPLQKIPLKTKTSTENLINKEIETTQQTTNMESQQESEVLIVIETMDEDDNFDDVSTTNEDTTLAEELGNDSSSKDADRTSNSSDRSELSSSKQRAAKKKKR